MTTVVADVKRGIIVADTRVTTYGDMTQYAAEKLYRADGSIFGEAGDVENGLKFRRWILDGQPKRGKPSFAHGTDSKFSVLEIDKHGLWLWDYTVVRQRMMEEIFAIGSGHEIALYAIRVLGKTAEEAIEEAAKIDIHTALPIQTIHLREPRS